MAVVLIGGCVLLPSGVGGQFLGLTLIAVSILAFLPGTLCMFWYSRRTDRDLALMQADPLAHWTFKDEEWDQVRQLDDEWRRTSTRDGRMAAAIMGAIVGATFIGVGLYKGRYSMLLVGGAAFVLIWLGMAIGAAVWYRRTTLPIDPQEVWIGGTLAWFGGRCYRLRGYGSFATDVELCPGPPSFLAFSYQQMTAEGAIKRVARVPVPQSALETDMLDRVLGTYRA